MRICFLSRITLEHGVRGGMEQHAAQLASGLAGRDHSVLTITTAHPQGATRIDGAAGETWFLAGAPARRYTQAWWRESWLALQREHQRQPFDVIVSISAGAQANISRARHELRLPTVAVLQGTLGGEWRTRRRDLGSLRGWYRMARYLGQFPGQWTRWQQVKADVAHWIAVSHEVKADWAREMRLPATSISVVPNGVDVMRFQPDAAARAATRASLGIAADAPVLIAVGRLEQEKGVQIAIDALAHLAGRLPHAHLVVAGDGIYRATLAQQISALGLNERVHLLGFRPNSELPGLLAASDLFVLPSRRDEGFPVVIAEALATGVPVLGNRVGGIPSAIDHGRTGLLVPLDQPGAWPEAIASILSDERRRRAMGAVARQVAVARFSHAAMLDATERILQDHH